MRTIRGFQARAIPTTGGPRPSITRAHPLIPEQLALNGYALQLFVHLESENPTWSTEEETSKEQIVKDHRVRLLSSESNCCKSDRLAFCSSLPPHPSSRLLTKALRTPQVTSSTHSSAGLNNRSICFLTNTSNAISGMNKAGRALRETQ